MRKLIDSLFVFLLRLAVSYLMRYYDFVLDGVELWLAEKLPGLPALDDSVEDLEDIFNER